MIDGRIAVASWREGSVGFWKGENRSVVLGHQWAMKIMWVVQWWASMTACCALCKIIGASKQP